MARPVSRMRWPRWRRRAAASTLPTPQRSASRSKIKPMIRHGTTGRTCACRDNQFGRANGATARPESGWRGSPPAAALAPMRRSTPHLSQPTSTTLWRALSKLGPASSTLCEAADRAGAREINELAAQRLAAVLASAAANGDYRWNSGKRQFNLGLFRGLAGVGYTVLRRIDRSLPNVLVWE